jgi:beta-glucoside operon transcriptional antiterminator
MPAVRVLKVFNNNVVLAADERDVQFVLFGRGLGFKAAAGSAVDPQRVERRFSPSGSVSADRIAAMVDEIPTGDIELAQRLVELARTRLGRQISDHVLLPLADHLSFALRRAAQGVAEIEYPLRWEVQYLYPAEVGVARAMLDVVATDRGVRLPDVEAVPLALHLVNAQFDADMSATAQMTADLHRILDIIREEYGVRIDETSMEVARFVTHLRYLFLREQQGRKLTETPAELHAALRSARPREYTSAGRIGTLLADQYGWNVSTDEILYLALHVSRLVDAATSGAPTEGARP